MSVFKRVSKLVRCSEWTDLIHLLDQTKDGFVEVSARVSSDYWLVTIASRERADIELVRKEWSGRS